MGLYKLIGIKSVINRKNRDTVVYEQSECVEYLYNENKHVFVAIVIKHDLFCFITKTKSKKLTKHPV